MIVLWTANTERFCSVEAGLNDTADNLLATIKNNGAEVSPSTIYAVASILEEVGQAKVDVRMAKSAQDICSPSC